MRFGRVPVAHGAAMFREWRRVTLTGRYTYVCDFYRETEVVKEGLLVGGFGLKMRGPV